MPAGRPTKYHDGMIDLAEEYLMSCGREQTKLPTIEGLALHLEVDDERIGEWANAIDESGNLIHPEFHATVKKIKAVQKNQLIDDGLYGGKEVNSTMAIFLLKVNHGMIETSRQEHTGKDGTPIQVEGYDYAGLTKWIIGKVKQVQNEEGSTE